MIRQGSRPRWCAATRGPRSCRCRIVRLHACAALSSAAEWSLAVDTRRVPDGPHTFSLVVTDAAGNTQVATSPLVVVDNNGPPPPAAFTATAKGGGSNVIALAWRNPLNAPAPVTAGQVQLCQSACPAAVTVGSSGAAQTTAPGPGLYTVRFWLLDSQGRGGPHNAALATVTVPAAPRPAHEDHGCPAGAEAARVGDDLADRAGSGELAVEVGFAHAWSRLACGHDPPSPDRADVRSERPRAKGHDSCRGSVGAPDRRAGPGASRIERAPAPPS